MRLQKKSLSKINLTDLLRKKRSNLEIFLKETGIFSYELLVSRCASIGVVPPSESEFLKIRGNNPTPSVSSPTEGIVVLAPIETDEPEPSEEVENSSIEEEENHVISDSSAKKRRKNRPKE